MELSSNFSINEWSNNTAKNSSSPTPKDFNESCDDKKLKKIETCSSYVSMNQINSLSKYKQIKMHNDELEKHMKRQQSENEFCRQDSFLKKFSTRSHQFENSSDNSTPLSKRQSKKSIGPMNLVKNNSELNALLKTNGAKSDCILTPMVAKCDKVNLKDYFNREKKISLSSQSSTSSKRPSLKKIYFQKILQKCNYFVLSPDDNCMFIWLFVLNICILYNMWLVIARQSFEKLQILFSSYWKIADLVSDSIYLMDIFVHFRTGYLEQGLLVYDSKKLAINYVKSSKFFMDIFSLLPLEIFQIWYGSMPILRFPRFFKLYRLSELYYMTESRTLYPNVWRVANLTHILFLLGHWFAGFYFLISKAEGFKGHWSYPEPVDEFALLPRMYLRCLYWSTLTLTTIGDLPPPETNWQ